MLTSVFRLPLFATLGVGLLAANLATAQTQQGQQNQQGQQDQNTSNQDFQSDQQQRQADQQSRQTNQQRQQDQQSRQRDQQTQRDNYESDNRVRRDQDGQETRRRDDRSTRMQQQQGDFRQNQPSRGQQGAPAGLGVSVVDGSRGVVVREVAPGSPAEQAGIERGDEIVAIDGRRINSGDQLVQMISQHDPGTDVEVTLDRDGQEETLMANLDTRREALQFEGRQSQERWMGGGRDSQFARGSSPPWDADDVQRHVDALERQVSQLQRDIEDLRRMLRDDPGGRQFDQGTTSTQRSNQGQRSQDTRSNRSESQQRNFDRDQQNRARPDYDDENQN
jgi:C-terminal processing protease CtpA/Prc